jgi:DNA-binding MarR family transcriptional regulator
MAADSPTPPLLDEQLCFALHAASRAFTQRYRALLEPLGLTYTQYIVMLVLWEGDGLMVGDLGERLRLDSGTLTPLLKRLERDGLVERARDKQDERRVLVFLTDEGRALGEDVATMHSDLLCKLSFDAQELIALREKLYALIEVLDAPDASEP